MKCAICLLRGLPPRDAVYVLHGESVCDDDGCLDLISPDHAQTRRSVTVETIERVTRR